MRDLGRLGENTFATWCSQVGLNANPSIIDNTGWDYYVEFPISENLNINELHRSAINCKVQIKATDKQERKLAIKLSNLRQMATSQMPSFYLFLEFDGKSEVQKAFILHLDNNIIYKILKRIHEIEQGDSKNNLNTKTMTLKYSEINALKLLDGQCLKQSLLAYIGQDYSKYINDKSKFLKECGFEDGYGKVKFSIAGESSGIHHLIDLSLGLTQEINVQNLVNIEERFGIPSKKPNIEEDIATLKMGVIPPKKGKITFKEDNLSRVLTFDISFYNSPFSFYDYRKYTKFRIVGEFFELMCEPYIGKTNYNLTLGGDKRLEIKKLKDALALINLISRHNQTAIVELRIESFEPIVLDFKSKFVKRDLDVFNEIIKKVLKICQKIEIYEDIDVSLNELYLHKQKIEQLYIILTKIEECDFRANFQIDSDYLFKFEKVASIAIFCCQVGSHKVGIIFTIFGIAKEISKNKFRIDNTDFKVEKAFTYTSDTLITNNDILKSIENISSTYLEQYDVFYDYRGF